MNPLEVVTRRPRLSDFAAERTFTVDSTRAIRYLLGAYLVSVAAMGLARVLPSVFAVPFVVLSLSFAPGALLVVALAGDELRVGAEHVLYAFGSSLVMLMSVGALVNVLLPPVGVAKPLMPVPLAAGVTVTVALLGALARLRNPTGRVSVRIPPLWAPTPLAFLLLPLLSVVGVDLINATGVNYVLLFALLAVGAVPLVAVRWLRDRWHPLAIWAVALAILYHKSLWQYAGFGGRPHGINAWQAGRWSPGVTSVAPYTSELLQNGVLFPLFARLSDLFIMTQYEVVNPFFVSFIPLALYVAFRQYVRSDVAFLGAATFAFVHPFYYQYPTAGRAATPVLFLALFGVALSNEGLSPGSRAVLGVSFLAGIVVTHYGTSYYVAGAFAVALVVLYALRFVDATAGDWLQRHAPSSDGGVTAVRRVARRRSRIFSTSTVVFFLSAALGWYLYMRGGWKFELLPKHVYENLVTLVGGPSIGGRTTARVQESYTSLSIEVAKYIYILLAVLTVVGFAFVYYRRVVTRECSFDDHYLTIATALFGIFGTTIILSNWGGGRPMMVTFSFTTVFAVLGAVWLVEAVERIRTAATRHLPRPGAARDVDLRVSVERPVGAYVFAGLLMVLFVLNSGVAAATVLGDFAPSNVPAQSTLVANRAPQSQVTVHREVDIVTHVWLVQHLGRGVEVYGDTYGAREFDWYRPDIAARTPAVGAGYTPETKPQVLSVTGQRAGTQPGYLLVMGHNVELGAVWTGKFAHPVPLENLSLDRRNRIYTTGETRIYFYAEAERRAAEPGASDADDDARARERSEIAQFLQSRARRLVDVLADSSPGTSPVGLDALGEEAVGPRRRGDVVRRSPLPVRAFVV